MLKIFLATMIICEIKNSGVPDPPFGCSSTQTNTTLTISCKAGFHQGDPDYFCYLELFHKDTQQFVEIARKKQSCVFLLTEFRPKGLHTYRLYTENKHGSNKADSIIIRIGEETMKPNNRWKALSISLGVLAGLSAVAILCFIVYRIVVPFTHATTFNSLIEPNRDPYVDDHKLVDRMYASSLSTRRGSLTMGRYLRNNPLDCDECGRPNSQMISHASNKRPRSFPINNELSQSTDELTREKSSDLPFPLQRRCSDNRGYSSSIADSCLHTGNKSLTLDNVNAQCRPCKYALYNPTRSEDVLCENGQHRQLLSRHLTPGNNGTNIMATSHTRHLLVTQQSQNIKFHPENPNAPSRRCDDGGVFV